MAAKTARVDLSSLRQSGLCAPRLPVRPTSAALAAQTTLAAFYRSTLEGHRILTHILTCSPTLPRPTFVASAAKQDQQPSAARLSGPSVAPNFDARASNGSLPFS
ncbi:Uncharacterized protein HZ326_30786 [Fusarium oxysporum f. sp. albedinis]|nr:Uncharacterized protein HZ326_30786 [Fusarium oxysporum f. sp. albedinis]